MNNFRNIIFFLIVIFIIVFCFFADSGIKTGEGGYIGNSSEKGQISDNNSDNNIEEAINSTVKKNVPDDSESKNDNQAGSADIGENHTKNDAIEENKKNDASLDSKINSLIDKMTIEEKVGQMFFIVDDGRFSNEVLEVVPAGGIILFESDFRNKTKESVKAFTEGFQRKSKLPIFIGVDEEGGIVTRLSKFSGLVDKEFESPSSIFERGGFEAIKNDTETKSDILLDYGINVNFAPVCDYCDISGSFMYKRSFGISVDKTSEYVQVVVGVMKEKNIGSVLKHFPGYGNNGDTHTNIVRDKRYKREFIDNDWKVFEAGIKAGGDCILVSHNIVECIDDTLPASLSPDINLVIRKELNFDGVIITDDLKMAGVAGLFNEEEAAVKAVLAGNDMILSTYYQKQYDAVLQAVKKGYIKEDRIDESLRRILRWKIDIGIIK